MTLDELIERVPEAARDVRLNAQSILRQSGGALSPEQRWGVAVAAAVASRNAELRDAVIAAASAQVPAAVVDDGVAAAALMAMNNVYYRFRHLIRKPSYAERPARLRMNRLVKPATSQADFELCSLAVSAIHGCETCLASHEQSVLAHGLTEEHVHDAVRIAATIHAAAVALEARAATSTEARAPSASA